MAAFALSGASPRREERLGLVAAVAAHAGLLGWLAWHPQPPLPPTPVRMTVTLTPDVAVSATAPDRSPQAASEAAPMIGEAAPAPEPEPPKLVRPHPVPVATPAPVPAPPPPVRHAIAHPIVRPLPQLQPDRAPPPSPARAVPNRPRPARRAPVDPIAAIVADAPGPAPATKHHTAKPAGASRVGDDFLKGVATAQAGKAKAAPAAAIGPEVKGGAVRCDRAGG